MAGFLAEKVVQRPIYPEHLRYCPTMDLIALVTVDGQIHVYRLNGQRVFGTKHKQDSFRICTTIWKSNGETTHPILDSTLR